MSDFTLVAAQALASKHYGAPWYEDRVGDALEAITVAQRIYDPTKSNDTEFARLNQALTYAAVDLRRTSTRERAIAQLESTAADIIGPDVDLEFDMWVDHFVAQENPELDGKCLLTVDGIWLSYEEAAEVITDRAGESDPMKYQEILSALLDISEAADEDFSPAIEDPEPIPPTPTTVHKIAISKDRKSWKILSTETREDFTPPLDFGVNGVVDIETDAARFDPFEPEDDDKFRDIIPSALVPNTFLDLLAKAREYVKREVWQLARQVYLEQWEPRPAITLAEALELDRRITTPYNRIEFAAEKLVEILDEIDLNGDPDKAIQIIDILCERAELDERYQYIRGDVYQIATAALNVDRTSAYIPDLEPNRNEFINKLRDRVLAQKLWPSQAIKLIALADGLAPTDAKAQQDKAYDLQLAIETELDDHLYTPNLMALSSLVYPGLTTPKEHRVLIHGEHEGFQDLVLENLARLGGNPAKVELVITDNQVVPTDKLKQAGYTVTDFSVPYSKEAGIQQAKFYVTRVWLFGPPWFKKPWLKAYANYNKPLTFTVSMPEDAPMACQIDTHLCGYVSRNGNLWVQ